ncbi:MAG: hypothetical protein R3C05_09365 [Pirellulaceae bacterium]
MIHCVAGREYREKISTLRGDFRNEERVSSNKLRPWTKSDFIPSPEDVFQERLYAIHWMKPRLSGRRFGYEFRSVSEADLSREQIVENQVAENLTEWQAKGWIPDMQIEPGEKTDEQSELRGGLIGTTSSIPRQLLLASLINRFSDARLKFGFTQVLNSNARLSRWSLGDGPGRSGGVKQVFDNQALNTLFNYGTRGSRFALDLVTPNLKSFPLPEAPTRIIACHGTS